MKRFFVKYHKLFVVLLLAQIVMLAAGCGPLTWLTDAQNILPIVGNMVSLVLTLIATLSGGSIIPVDIAAVVAAVISKSLAGIKDIEAMVAEYKANPSPTLLGSIEEGTKAVIDGINQFLTDTLGSIVNTAAATKISDILTLVLNEVMAFQSLLPALAAAAGQHLSIVVPMTSKEAKAAFNAILNKATGDSAVDAALAQLPRL